VSLASGYSYGVHARLRAVVRLALARRLTNPKLRLTTSQRDPIVWADVRRIAPRRRSQQIPSQSGASKNTPALRSVRAAPPKAPLQKTELDRP